MRKFPEIGPIPEVNDDPVQILLDQLSKEDSAQAVEDLRLALSTPFGRRNMWRMWDEFFMWRQTFTGNSEAYFRDGQRDVCLKYFGMIMDHMPEMMIQMLQDRIDLKRRREAMIRAAEQQGPSG